MEQQSAIKKILKQFEEESDDLLQGVNRNIQFDAETDLIKNLLMFDQISGMNLRKRVIKDFSENQSKTIMLKLINTSLF